MSDKYRIPLASTVPARAQEKKQSGVTIEANVHAAIPLSSLEVELDELRMENHHLKQQLEFDRVQLNKQRSVLAESIRNEIYEKSFAEGLAGATAEIEEIHHIEKQILNSISTAINKYEKDIVKVVLAAVGKILGDHIVRPEMAISAVKEVLVGTGHQEHILVHVSPKDHQVLERYRRQILPASNIEYIADDRVKVGGCIVKLDRGMLDGRIEVQLQTLIDTLIQARAEQK